MTINTIKITDPTLDSFYKNNPDFDVLTFDFHNKESLAGLSIPESDKNETTKELMAYQRLLRLYPDASVAQRLISDNIDSSIKITAISQSVFIKTYGPKFGPNGPEIARKIYTAAMHSKAKVMHLVASVKNVAGSSNFNALLFNHISDDVTKTFEDLSSYQDFFGSLDYCDCEECKSIFGPAAYLVDLLRIIDKGITQPNSNISDGLHLFDRRPDLQTIELTCENTNHIVPYLEIVNNILKGALETSLKQENKLVGGDAYLTLANTYYPFNLPFNLPLQQIDAVMDNKKVLLSDIALVLSKDAAISNDEARKILKLSVETLNNLKSQDPATLAGVVSSNYGLAVSDSDLKGLDQVDTYLEQSGLSLTDLKQLLTQNLSAKECFDVSGGYTPTLFGPNLTLKQDGSSITGTYGIDGALKGTIDGLVAKGQWHSETQALPSQKGDFEFTFTASGGAFTGKWSKGLGMPWENTAWNGSLNGTSTQGIIPHSLFINGTLPEKQYLQIKPGNNNDTIAGQSLGTLDRLNRFIRLSRAIGWSYADLNWILKTLGAQDITDSTFLELAKIKQCIDKYGLDLNLLSCLWFDIKTIGMGPGPESEAPFDRIFNTQTIIQQTGSAYHPTIAASSTSFVNPLYKDQVVLFVVDQQLYKTSDLTPATKQQVSQGQIVIKGIPASQDDVLAIAVAAFGKVATIDLTVSNMSTLYRHVMLAKQLNITVDRYVQLLKLLGYGNNSDGSFAINAILDRDEVLSLFKTAQKIQSAGFTVYDIDYLCNQTNDAPISPFVNPGYKKSALPEFLSTIRTLLTGSKCQKDSFTYNSLTGDDSEQIFNGFVALGFINSSGLIVKDLATLTAADWNSIQIGDPKTTLLDAARQAFVLSKLETLQAHQASLFANQVGAFFGVKEDIASLAIEAARGSDQAYLQIFITVPDPTSTAAAEKFILSVSKGLMLQRLLALPVAEFSSICLCPNAYGLSAQNDFSMASVLAIANLKPAIQAFGDTDNNLVQYLSNVWASPAPSVETLQAELCAITSWNKEQYASVANIVLADADGCRTLSDVLAVKAVFDIANNLGIDTYFLQELDRTTSLAATETNWPTYNDVATKLLLTLQATASSEAVQYQYKKIKNAIEGKKRDAMLDFSIWVLGKQWTDIKTPRNLYEFLLIDPENCGCSEISLVKEALNAAQLYLQRCRLNLEKDVLISTDDIPDVWWEWLLNYRIWQANRKIFVYPENYIEPSLRKSKSTLFQSLENTLLQGEVTADLVETAYLKYLDDFSNLAKLRYVDAYQTIVHDKERGAIDTLFLFARTHEQPYHFYYITRETVGDCDGDNQYLWSEWKSINIKIDAEHITPIYAFNKLFVFWVELTKSKESGGLTGKTGDSTTITSHSNIITKATIKYSYYNFNGKWAQPQTLVADKVVNVFSSENNIYGSFFKQFTDTEASCWNRVSVINTGPANYVGDVKSFDEKLIVYFGPLANYDDLDIEPLIPDPENDTSSVYAFKEMLKQAYFNLEQMKYFNRVGYIPLCSHFVIDEILSHQIILRQHEYLVLASNTLSKFMTPTFSVEISDRSLAITTNYSTVATNNSDGIEKEYTGVVAGPQAILDSSFIVYPYIDADQSKIIQAQIIAKMPEIIDSSNKITQAALSKTISDISSKLGISEDQAHLVQTRFYELFYGSRVLFSNVEHNANVVPVKNQPNTFILDNGSEAFLLTANNNVIESTASVLTSDSFVSATIDKSTSETYFHILSKKPNNYILENGTVNTTLLNDASPYDIGILLVIPAPYTEATNIINILKTASDGTAQKVVKKDYTKIDSQIRITATLTPNAFVSSTIDKDTSASYFNKLSIAPNNYIQADGSVDINMVKNADGYAIALLLGLQPSDPNVTRIVNILKSAANLVTKDSFVTSAINPVTSEPYIDQLTSESYFRILSKAPNNFIRPDGSVDRNFLNNVSTYTIALLLGLSENPDDFAVAKVLSVLRSSGPVALSYAYPNEPDAQTDKTLRYEHDNIYSLQFVVERLSTGAINQLSHAMSFGGIDSALALNMQQPPVNIKKPFSHIEPIAETLEAPLQGPVIVTPSLISNQEVAFQGPYGKYYWELFFHTPFLVASMLNANQQFSDAEKWLQYIFNPTMQKKYLTKDVFIAQRPQDIDAGTMENLYPILTTPPNRYIDGQGNVTSLAPQGTPYALSLLLALSTDQSQEILNLLNSYYVNKQEVRAWQFDPFRNYTLQTLLQNLSSCAQITEYNDDPFDPDAIARLRIGAYEKTIVMKYIDNLLDWGDFEFSQYSWESITAARMYYCYAYDLLGTKPVNVESCESTFPVTFQDIAAKYKDGNIPQFLIDMEHLSSGIGTNPASGNSGKAYNDLGDYFCIPDNAQLTAYWDRVEDRLYKIRHCLNIEGVAQPLPLFQPPINPMDLVRASAQGGNVLNVANHQQQNISYYRFTYLIERAKAVTGLVSEFGNALLNALEKSDGESLALLHLNQAKIILNMTLSVKNKQLEGLENQLAGLQQSLESAQNRNLFYTTLINAGYNSSENSGLSYMQASIDVQAVVAGIQGISVAGYLAPCIFGFSDGGMKFGDAINMGAQMLQTTSQVLSQQGGVSQTVAQYQRRKEDWQLQQQLAQFDINQIQDQISSMQASIASSQQEIEIQKKSIEQNQDETAFYQSKFTDQELYQWMTSRVSAIYFQAYKLALDMALTAQMAYQYELDRDDSFIAFGYWDSLHKGLLAADGLRLSLAQLENAYTDNNERRLEIEKTISLKTLNPEAFYAFKSGPKQGNLIFSLTEELYDRDFPSHYCRRIKSVSVSIPAVVGPYQNIHATLTQNTNLVVLTPDKDVVNYAIYQTAPQKSGSAPAEPPAGALRQNWVSNQQIALSKGIDDSGLFVLNFEDQRYLPFEETGAVSTWTLSMPPSTNQIDFAGISDIILSVKYTAKEGGSHFGNDVTGLYSGTDKQYQNIRINSFNINQAFANTWYSLFQASPDNAKQQTLTFPITEKVVLPNLKNVKLNQIVIDLETASGSAISSNTTGLSLKVGTDTVAIDIENNRGTVSETDIGKITQWQGVDWTLIFSPEKLPELSTSNQLDSSKLLNAIVMVMYTSDM